MVSKYIRPLNGNARLQSGLGRVTDVYLEDADSLLMAEVVKVNYIYNTVDVVTVKNRERVIQKNETKGKYSARLPVQFGGSLSNGQTYGSVVPVNIGDDVLIGFLEKDKTSPIVLGIYKPSNVSSSLAPTDKVAGNPEDPNLFSDSFDSFTLFPSQTYRDVDGRGNVEITLPGKSFFKLASGLIGGGKLSDDNFEYEDLSRYRLRDRDVEPLNTAMPQMMYRQQGDDSPFITTVLFDNDGSFALSHMHRGNKSRSDIQIDTNGNTRFRYQSDSRYRNDSESTKWAEIGISDGKPSLLTNNREVILDDEKGLLIDGKPISDYLSDGGGIPSKEIEEIKKEIEKLKTDLDGVSNTDIKELQDSVQTLSEYIDKTVKPNMTLINDMGSQLSDMNDKVNANDALVKTLTDRLSDAQGDYPSLNDRLKAMESSAAQLQGIVDEIVDARTDKNGTQYNTIGARLDSLSKLIDNISTTLGDYADVINIVNSLVNRVSTNEDNISNFNHKIDSILTADVSKEVNKYLVTINPIGSLNFKDGVGSTTLEAQLYKFGYDFTDKVKANGFIWNRKSNDTSGDITWNNAHKDGAKSIIVKPSDISVSAVFTCSVTVDGNLID